MPDILFFSEEISFTLANEGPVRNWLISVATQEGYRIDNLSYIFCPDEYLLKINQEYLDHDYYTDIITFDHSETANSLSGDIFISIDRVRENASTFAHSFDQELMRVMVHGLLHLIGYGDKTEDEEKVMRQKEDACLSLLKK